MNAPAQPFDTAMAWILSIEGGYVDDPSDRGGETKYGISKRQYPWLDIESITKEDAADFYRKDYWVANNCNKLPQAIGLYLFDCVVNHRATTGIKFLQLAIGAKADGIIGPLTIKKSYQVDARTVIHSMNVRRARYYFDMVMASKSQAKFLDGWTSRLFLLTDYLHDKKLIEAQS